MLRGAIIPYVAGLLVVLPVGEANACAAPGPRSSPIDALRADAVIIGHVRDYRRGEDRYQPFPVAVKQILRGDLDRRITVSWGASNIDVAERLDGDYVFVLLNSNPSFQREASADYIIAQGICSGASVFPRGSAEANAIRDVFGLAPEVTRPSRENQIIAIIPYALLMVLGVFVAVVLLWSRRPRQKTSQHRGSP